MKWLAVILCSMVAGAVGGAFVAMGMTAQVERAHSVPMAVAERIQTKELLLVDAEGNPAARLRATGAAELEFFGPGGKQVLLLRASRGTHSGSITFTGDSGRTSVALVMRPPTESNEGALYLGDNGWEGRVGLGAIGTDIEGAPTEEWGLQVQSPKYGHINALIESDRAKEPRAIFGVSPKSPHK